MLIEGRERVQQRGRAQAGGVGALGQLLDGADHVCDGFVCETGVNRQRHVLLEHSLGNRAVARLAEHPGAEGGRQVHGAIMIPSFDSKLAQKRPHEKMFSQKHCCGCGSGVGGGLT